MRRQHRRYRPPRVTDGRRHPVVVTALPVRWPRQEADRMLAAGYRPEYVSQRTGWPTAGLRARG